MKGRKTSRLLQTLTEKVATSGGKAIYINNSIDTRKSVINDNVISTHSATLKRPLTIDCIKVKKLSDVDVSDYDYIGVDESQFFDDLYPMVLKWNSEDKFIVCAGLDGDSRQKKFGSILDLIPKSSYCKKFNAVCKPCKTISSIPIDVPAPFTRKISGSEDQIIEIGGDEKFIPVCEYHYGCDISIITNIVKKFPSVLFESNDGVPA